MSNEREEINIDPDTRGIIVFAKETTPIKHYGDWILLIDRLERAGGDEYFIYTHICKRADIGDCKPNVGHISWGFLYGMDFKFYKPTPEEIQIVKDILKENNKKFVKGINKVIDRIYDG